MNYWLNGLLSRLSQDYLLDYTDAITSLTIAVNLGPNKEPMQTCWTMAGFTQAPPTANSGPVGHRGKNLQLTQVQPQQGTMPPAVDSWAALGLELDPKGSGLPIWSPHSMSDI